MCIFVSVFLFVCVVFVRMECLRVCCVYVYAVKGHDAVVRALKLRLVVSEFNFRTGVSVVFLNNSLYFTSIHSDVEMNCNNHNCQTASAFAFLQDYIGDVEKRGWYAWVTAGLL